MSRNVVTILLAIAAAVIAWFLVNALFGLIAFLVKLIVVAFVAVLVYVVLRLLLARSGRR